MNAWELIGAVTAQAAAGGQITVLAEGEAATALAAAGFRFEIVGFTGGALRLRVTNSVAATTAPTTGDSAPTMGTRRAGGEPLSAPAPSFTGQYLVDGDVVDIEVWLAENRAGDEQTRQNVLALRMNETYNVAGTTHIIMKM